MKTVLATLAALAFTVAISAADLTDKLIGVWAGPGTSVSGGTVTKTYATTKTKRFQKRGMKSVTRIETEGQGFSQGTTLYYDSGRVEGKLERQGKLVALITGRWSVEGNTLIVKAEATGLFPSFRAQTKSILVNKRKLSGTGKTSNGVRTVSTMKKIG